MEHEIYLSLVELNEKIEYLADAFMKIQEILLKKGLLLKPIIEIPKGGKNEKTA